MEALISRRAMLATTAAGAAVLAGCAPDQPGSGNGGGGGGGGAGAGSGGDVAPRHIPWEGVEPEFPAGDGIPAGYTRIPDELGTTGVVPLPAIDPISMLIQGSPPAVGFAENAYYKQLSADTGTDFNVTYGGYSEYVSKFQTLVASDDLPDVVMSTNVPQFPDLLRAKFTDLTEFLGGDAVEEFPALASISPGCWKVPVVDGQLWGVSKSRPAAEGKLLLARGDLLAERGIDPDVSLSNVDDLMSLFTELTDRGDRRFAIGQDPRSWLMPLLLEMFGAPNGWRVTDGAFTHQYESPEMAAALEQATMIWEAEVMHPEAFSNPEALTWLEAGTTSLVIDGVAGWTKYVRQHPDWDVQGIIAPKAQGGGPAVKHLTDAGYPSFCAIRKQNSPDRVREILRVINHIASPFGTKEWLSVNYGIEGEHYTMVDGAPEVTDQRQQEFFKIDYLGSQADAQLFIPGDTEMVRRQHEFLSAVMPTGEADAADGLYSDTFDSKGPIQQRKVSDAIGEIIQGRKPMSDWEGVVAEWRSTVGDKARGEYEEAYAAQN